MTASNVTEDTIDEILAITELCYCSEWHCSQGMENARSLLRTLFRTIPGKRWVSAYQEQDDAYAQDTGLACLMDLVKAVAEGNQNISDIMIAVNRNYLDRIWHLSANSVVEIRLGH